jgi:hypothetical protein
MAIVRLEGLGQLKKKSTSSGQVTMKLNYSSFILFKHSNPFIPYSSMYIMNITRIYAYKIAPNIFITSNLCSVFSGLIFLLLRCLITEGLITIQHIQDRTRGHTS